jgi:hypothetical protein
MTKSIQRAIATHGHYKNIGIQQRRMTFDSTSSSYEQTLSLMKLQVESFENQSQGNTSISSQPLDLRMSPALRRDPKTLQIIPKLQKSTVQVEEMNLVLRRWDSESSLVTNYQSCISEVVETPKVSVQSSILKKTISFETPAMIDMTPAMLMPNKLLKNSESDDDEVFYTPQATPKRRFSMESGMRAMELSSKLKDTVEEKKAEETKSPKKKNKFWNWFENAANFAKRSSGGSSGSEGEFYKIKFINYFI